MPRYTARMHGMKNCRSVAWGGGEGEREGTGGDDYWKVHTIIPHCGRRALEHKFERCIFEGCYYYYKACLSIYKTRDPIIPTLTKPAPTTLLRHVCIVLTQQYISHYAPNSSP